MEMTSCAAARAAIVSTAALATTSSAAAGRRTAARAGPAGTACESADPPFALGKARQTGVEPGDDLRVAVRALEVLGQVAEEEAHLDAGHDLGFRLFPRQAHHRVHRFECPRLL